MVQRVRTVVKPKAAPARVRTTVKPPPKTIKNGTQVNPATKGEGTRVASRRKRLTLEAIRELDENMPGLFPHQRLLEITRTGKVWPDQKKRMEGELYVKVLGMAAPYFAPRMASVHLKNDPPFLNGDLTRLSRLDPDKVAIANEVLGELFGGDYKDRPILDLQRIGVARNGGVEESTGNVYGDTLAAETDGEDDE